MVVIFNLQNSHLFTLSLSTEEVFQVNGKNRPVANLPDDDFHSQPREMPTPKLLNTKLSVFLLVYCFFPFWESSNFTVFQRYGFVSVLTVTIRESSNKLPCIESRESFASHSSTWPSGAKCGWRSAADWPYQHTWKNTIFFFFNCVVTGFLRAGNPCISPQFMW